MHHTLTSPSIQYAVLLSTADSAFVSVGTCCRERRAARSHNYAVTKNINITSQTPLWPLPRESDGEPLECNDGLIYTTTFTGATDDAVLDRYLAFYSLTAPTKPANSYYHWDAKKAKAKAIMEHLGCDCSTYNA